MPRIRDVLDRFRPSGAPGAASGAAVPADRAAEQAIELAPVFAALADTQAEVARIRAAGAAGSARRREAAAEVAAQIVARARQRAEAERGDAFTRSPAAAVAAGEELIGQGGRAADEIRRRAADALPGHVAVVIDAALREVSVRPVQTDAGRLTEVSI